MAYKNLYIDLETTGLDHTIHGITQIGAVAEIGNEIVSEISILCRPFKADLIDPVALDVQNVTEEQIRSKKRRSPKGAFREFVAWLEKFVDPFDEGDKFSVHAHNANFDMRFLSTYFEKNNSAYFGSYQDNKPVCTVNLCRIMHSWDMELITQVDSLRLTSLTKYFNIPHEPHEALSDARACRLLYKILCNHIALEAQNHIGGDQI